MTEEEIPGAIVCMPADGGIPTKGSVLVFCFDCRKRVWLSRSGQALIERFPLIPAICVPCCLTRLKREGDDPKFEIVPGAIEELREEFGGEQSL